MAKASDKSNKYDYERERKYKIFSLFFTWAIHNRVKLCEQNFV